MRPALISAVSVYLFACSDLPANFNTIAPNRDGGTDAAPPTAACPGGALSDEHAQSSVGDGHCEGVDTVSGRRCLPLRAWRSYDELRDESGTLWYPILANQPEPPLYIYAYWLSGQGTWILQKALLIKQANKVCNETCQWQAPIAFADAVVPLESFRPCAAN